VLQDSQCYQHQQPWEVESNFTTPSDWFTELEETVVLSRPDADPSADDTHVSEGSREIACDLTYEWPSPQRRSPPIWAVAAALLVGATLAFSANAMMRRPTRLVTASKPAAAVPHPRPAPNMVRPPEPVAPSPTFAAPPIVVPVAPLPPEAPPQPAWSAHPATRRLVAHRQKHGNWNDPFDNKPVSRSASKTGSKKAASAAPAKPAPAKPGVTGMDAAETAPDTTIPAPVISAPDPAPLPAPQSARTTTWVDPFAN
jgi:hypothetical protein